jgi:trimethylamine:corrinoid methyltransferase-like protein
VTWEKRGAVTAERAATEQWKELLERYEDPGIDAGVDAELGEFIARRKAEIEAE